MQPDTIIPDQTNPQTWNRFAYTINNPVLYNDPDGHCGLLCVVVVSAAVLAVPFVLSSLAVGPDAIGVDIATAVMGGDGDALVATGLAVQSQYPWAMITGGGKGWAQATNLELGGKNPFSPSVSINIMEKRITDGITACTKCAAGSDLLVVAALAQNGFDPQLFKLVQKNKENNTLDWIGFLDAYGDTTRDPFAQMRQTLTGRNFETELMLKIYMQDLREMLKRGYKLSHGITMTDVLYVEKNIVNPKKKQME